MGRSGGNTRWRLPRPVTFVVLVALLALTVVLSYVASAVNANNESRLLKLQVTQATVSLDASIAPIQAQLYDAIRAAALPGSRKGAIQDLFRGRLSSEGYRSASLWQIVAGRQPRELDEIGNQAYLIEHRLVQSTLGALHPSAFLYVTPILSGNPPHIGFAEMPRSDPDNLVMYVEESIPADRRVALPTGSAFHDLNFALYLGTTLDRDHLIESTYSLPLPGPTETASIPFGNNVITVVGSATSPLTGSLSSNLSWVVLIVGIALALVAAVMAEYVSRRRHNLEELASENAGLYLQQRGIAGTLQRALLPESLPAVDGLDVAVRYLPGVEGIDVGGDWYDVITTDDAKRCLVVVGDVSGRGLRAATTMASLRYAVRAYASQGDRLDAILVKLGDLLNIGKDHQFATVLLCEADVPERSVRIASAGHLSPVVASEGKAMQVVMDVDPPVGTGLPVGPVVTTVDLPPGATLYAFTDGLVERRDEELRTGIERLCEVIAVVESAGARDGGGPDEAAESIVHEMLPDGTDDDAVLMALRWRT